MKKLLVLMAGIAMIFLMAPSAALAECDVCGDLTGDGEVDIADITAFVGWYFNWPNPITPPCPCGGDVNCDGGVNVDINNPSNPNTDLGYMIQWMFYGGPDLCDPDDDSVPNCDPCG